jgi:putative ABC transport system permease protein
MPAVFEDVRFALRQLRRAPGFAASAVLTLAIGIGANTGIFSLQNGYWRPLPVPDAGRIVVLAAQVPGDDDGLRYRFSYPELIDYRSQAEAFSDVFAYDTRIGGLTAGGKTTQFLYHVVSGNLFSALGLHPTLGRFFAPGEGERAGDPVLIVLAHTTWVKRFASDPGAIGTTIRVDGLPAQIVGVAPPGFHGLYQGADIEGYLTLATLQLRSPNKRPVFDDRGIRLLTTLARMKPGVSLAAAQASVDVVAQRLQAAHPAEEFGVTVRVIPEPAARPVPLTSIAGLLPLIRTSSLLLAMLVLLIACMNVANLLLVRATARQREMAVRAALGSGRARLVRLLIVESLVLSTAGLIAGLVFARWSTDLFLGMINPSMTLPLNLDFDYDWRVFVYASAVAIVTGLGIGLVPALRAARARITGLLHDGGQGSSAGGRRLRVRSTLVIAQVAGSLVLLVIAGLFVRSLQRAQTIDLGFDPSNILIVRLDPRQVGYSVDRTAPFYEELERRLQRLPGVERVAMTFTVPTGYLFDAVAAMPDGRTPTRDEPETVVGCNAATPSYFDTMRIPIVAGRGFVDQDVATSTPVIVVNETLAKRMWPGQDPIGKRLTTPRFTPSEWQVVGVARDSKYIAVFEGPTPHLYFPMKQNPSFMRVVHLKTSVPPDALAPAVEREIQALDPEMPIADLKSMQAALEGSLGFLLFRIGAWQASSMGLLGLLLAAVGIYGVVSYSAAQRTREMGIRIALGAPLRSVRWLVLRQGGVLVIGGIVFGLLAATQVTRLISTFFVLVSSTDVVTFAAVTLLLSLIALLACYLPARRATRVDPVTALRHE